MRRSVLRKMLKSLIRYKYLIITLILILVGILCVNKYLIHEPETVYPQIQKLDSIADTIRKNNDSIITTIKNNEKVLLEIRAKYEKDSITIVNQSVDSDYEYFTNYLKGFFDNNNSDSTKTN